MTTYQTLRSATLALLLLTATAGCPGQPSTPYPVLPRAEYLALERIDPAAFPAEIARVERIVSAATDPREKAAAQHRLALLHLAPANPQRDLDQGAVALRIYVDQMAAGEARNENRLWLQILGERILLEKNAEGREGKNNRAAAHKLEVQELTRQIQDLAAANAKLQADIEKLKMIDLSVEKKRQSSR
jgi:hypothetical protein